MVLRDRLPLHLLQFDYGTNSDDQTHQCPAVQSDRNDRASEENGQQREHAVESIEDHADGEWPDVFASGKNAERAKTYCNVSLRAKPASSLRVKITHL